ncbi:hypothetical protein N7533_012415 [Penicillium manginii]|jgi:hypothetical protein|uniref:uncharacterized protein n=1 Tax=Penicillium manginii TaxID=203109 RepID=UPI00254678D1|nr:uncharacterized protein N7533_012415 [Penicillium manginii]KAJ5739631.1 hypothetical protein N7533_012415 [Penicillium manginii]
MRPSYFLMRNQDYEFKPDEPNGWFNLGSILTNPLEPESLLEDYSIIAPRDYMEVKHMPQEDVKIKFEELRSSKNGIFAKFLELLSAPLGLNIMHTQDKAMTHAVSLEKLETYFMTPTKSYLDRVLRSPAVQKYVREHLYCSCPYIVTGLRVAIHGSGFDLKENSKRSDLNLSVDAAAPFGGQGLLKFGPSVCHENGLKWSKSHGNSHGYIYAYRVAKIYFSVRQSAPKLRNLKGELLGVNEEFPQDYLEGNEAYMYEARMQEDEWFPATAISYQLEDEYGDIRLFVPPPA